MLHKAKSGECSQIFRLPSKSLKIKKYEILILPVLLHICETW
jgi:hypothetical protein